MDIQVKTEKFKYLQCVYDGYITSDESIEMIVPDALPDISEMLETKAICCLKGKDSDDGSVTIKAQITGEMIYLPENSTSLQKIDIVVPVTISAFNENIKSTCRLIASVGITSIEAKMINPRKFTIKAVVCAEISCFDTFEYDISSEINGPVQVLKKEAEISAYGDVSEKLYVVSDEIKIDSTKRSIGDILSSDINIITEEIKAIGSKVIINGILRCSILYTSPDENGIFNIKNENRFSQVIEMNKNCENAELKIINCITGIYLNADLIAASNEKAINYEVHVVSQCVSVEKIVMPLLLDAYDPHHELYTSLNKIALSSITLDEIAADSIKVSVPCNGISEIISARGNITSITKEDHGNEASIYISGSVSIIYTTENGTISSSSYHFRDKISVKKENNETISVSEFSEISISSSVASGLAECRISVKLKLTKTSKTECEQITALSYDEDRTIDTSSFPSLVIHKPKNSDTIWNLIKKHHSSEELMLSINEAENEETLLSKEFILVPKY